MKIFKVPLAFAFILFLACSNNNRDSVDRETKIEGEIKALESNPVKRAYLEQILADDQSVRDGQKISMIRHQYGKDSDEYMAYVNAQWEQDDINLMKVEKYFQIHGYPSKELGNDATTAPWMVIHHARDYGPRERNFETIYEAYLKGYLDDGEISFYLGRMYRMKFGERHDMEGSYKAEKEINLLIKKLELSEEQAKVQARLKGE